MMIIIYFPKEKDGININQKLPWFLTRIFIVFFLQLKVTLGSIWTVNAEIRCHFKSLRKITNANIYYGIHQHLY